MALHDKINEQMKKSRNKQFANKWNSSLRSNEVNQRRMTFGKHAGKFITELPDSYIEWCIKNIDDDYLAEWFKHEYIRRYPNINK